MFLCPKDGQNCCWPGQRKNITFLIIFSFNKNNRIHYPWRTLNQNIYSDFGFQSPFLISCTKLKGTTKRWNVLFGVLKQFGITCRVHVFVLQKSLHPIPRMPYMVWEGVRPAQNKRRNAPCCPYQCRRGFPDFHDLLTRQSVTSRPLIIPNVKP